MKIAIMQPYLFPYLGYFMLINAVDRFIFYDDVTYIKQGWINRNYLNYNGEKTRFTLPLVKSSTNSLIKDVCIDASSVQWWLNKKLKGFKQHYASAPYFDEVLPIFERIGTFASGDSIAMINCELAKDVLSYLGITTEIVESSTVYGDHVLSAQDRVLSICGKNQCTMYINPIGGKELYSAEEFEKHGIELRFLRPLPVEYPTGKNEFIPDLSILDVLMFNSKDRVLEFLESYELE